MKQRKDRGYFHWEQWGLAPLLIRILPVLEAKKARRKI